jgi:hypothetical protein
VKRFRRTLQPALSSGQSFVDIGAGFGTIAGSDGPVAAWDLMPAIAACPCFERSPTSVSAGYLHSAALRSDGRSPGTEQAASAT